MHTPTPAQRYRSKEEFAYILPAEAHCSVMSKQPIDYDKTFGWLVANPAQGNKTESSDISVHNHTDMTKKQTKTTKTH